LKFSPGDLVITTEPLYGFNEVVGEWVKILPETKLIYIEYHNPSDKIRVLLPGGSINWLDGYEEGYLKLISSELKCKD
jgi:hypothetical protein